MSSLAQTIATLPERIASLDKEERVLVNALFSVTRSEGQLVPPPEMEAWIERAFGSVEAVRTQTIVKTLNRWTLEGSLFNELRARRPIESRPGSAIAALEGDGTDPFCNPLTGTPADSFGRVEGSLSITASNVAKYDGLHSVVIMREHNPLTWTRERVADALGTAVRWLEEAHRDHPTAAYPFIMWNCLPRSGASQLHAHMQVTLGEGSAYARVEQWRRAALAYRQEHARSYFEDFYLSHYSLGLGGTFGGGDGAVRWIAHITPLKEKELILFATAMTDALYSAIHQAVRLYIDKLGVLAFNVALYMPPLAPTEEDWSSFPVIVRMVDRGDPASATSDIGAMELFAQPVVAFDPFRLAAQVKIQE